MDKLRVELKNVMDMKGITQSDIAKNAGVSDGTISNFFKGEEIFLDTFISMSQQLVPEKEVDLVKHYLSEVTKHKSIRMALEYISTHKLLDMMNDFLRKAKSSNNAQTKEKGKLYELVYEWQINNNKSMSYQTLKSIKDVKTKNHEEKLIQMIFEMYYYYYNSNYKSCLDVIRIIEEKISGVTNQYLKKSFETRVEELKCFLELRVNCNKDEARVSAERLIKCSTGYSYTAYGYYVKGLSYMFEDLNVCLVNLQTSIKYYKKTNKLNNVHSVKKQINFIENVFGKSQTNDGFYDIIFKLIENGNVGGLKEIIDESHPKFVYLFGLAEQSEEKLMHSLIGYAEEGDAFMAQLPELALNNIFKVDSSITERIKYINKVS